MTSQENLLKFNDIYEETKEDILKYIIIKCHNINDVNDIMQDTYFEFWKILNKKEINEENIKSYLIGIANNKIKKYYTLISKLKTISLFTKNKNDILFIDTIKDNADIEKIIIQNDNWKNIWQYIKNKKNQDIPKVFYLYYELDLTIIQIAKELSVSESYIKHLIYRTLHELQEKFNNGGEK